MAKENVVVRVDSAVREKLESESRERGITISEIIRERIDYAIRFPGPLVRFLDDFAERLKFSRSQVLSAIVVDYMARRAARQAVWPKEKRVLMEFIRTENGPMDADLLFQNLYNNYKKDFKLEKEKIFFEELNRYEKYGFGEKRILELYKRFGYQYPKEANEDESYIKKAREKGYLKSEYELNQITEKLVIDLIKIYEKGELTEEELKTEIENLFEHESGEWMSE